MRVMGALLGSLVVAPALRFALRPPRQRRSAHIMHKFNDPVWQLQRRVNDLLCRMEVQRLYHELALFRLTDWFSFELLQTMPYHPGVVSVSCKPGCKLLDLHGVQCFSVTVAADRMGNRESYGFTEITEGDGRAHCFEAWVQGHCDPVFDDVVSWWRTNGTEDHIPMIVDFLRQLATSGTYCKAQGPPSDEWEWNGTVTTDDGEVCQVYQPKADKSDE